MVAIASFIVKHSKNLQKDIKTLSDSLLQKEYDKNATKMLSDEKKILNIILEWEKQRNQKEPARIEMGRTLKAMEIHELAAQLNLYN